MRALLRTLHCWWLRQQIGRTQQIIDHEYRAQRVAAARLEHWFDELHAQRAALRISEGRAQFKIASGRLAGWRS
jgi:hypothetical protein